MLWRLSLVPQRRACYQGRFLEFVMRAYPRKHLSIGRRSTSVRSLKEKTAEACGIRRCRFLPPASPSDIKVDNTYEEPGRDRPSCSSTLSILAAVVVFLESPKEFFLRTTTTLQLETSYLDLFSSCLLIWTSFVHHWQRNSNHTGRYLQRGFGLCIQPKHASSGGLSLINFR